NLGHCFVFSRWGDKDPTACRPAEGGYYLASGHEGNHVSVRLLHPWGKGRYTFTLRRESKDEKNSRELWVGADVYSHQTKEEYFVGALQFPGSDLKITSFLGSFVEVYDRYPKAFPRSIPSAEVSIGNVRVNGEPERPLAVLAVYPNRVPRCA